MAPKLKLLKERHINQGETAASVRKYRRESNISLTEVAHAMGFTPAQASLLETGKRTWTPETHAAYLAAIDKLKG